jgi:hypothetical protein
VPPLAVKVVDGVAQLSASPLLLLIDAVGNALIEAVTAVLTAEIQPVDVFRASA